MFKIVPYQDRHGKFPVMDYLRELAKQAKTNKNARIRLTKILDYLDQLERVGTRIGHPVVKHIEGDIWELRPTNDRIFFFYWDDNIFVLLYHFVKKTQKTPQREIEQARRNLNDFLERNGK